MGSADTRIYKRENLQILAIFVKLSVVRFKQQWLCFHKGVVPIRELSFSSSSQDVRHHPWPWALPGAGLRPPPQLGSANSERSEMGLQKVPWPTPSFIDGETRQRLPWAFQVMGTLI